jgi:hypothetical protein
MHKDRAAKYWIDNHADYDRVVLADPPFEFADWWE